MPQGFGKGGLSFISPHHSTDFSGYRSVVAGVVVATCTTSRTLPAIFKTSPKALVRPGKRLTYRVRFRSTDPANALTGLKVDISLPPYVNVIAARTYPYPNGHKKASAAGTLSNGVITWRNLTISAKKTRSFSIYMRVARDAPAGTAISFGCTLYQTNASPGDAPYCPQQLQNATVGDL